MRVSNYGSSRSVVIQLGLSLIAISASLAGNRAWGGVDPPTKEFYLSMAPSARLLDSLWTPDYYDVKYEEQCDNPHLRVRARNMPAIRIDNFSTTLAPITSFTLQINEGPYIFGSGDGGSSGFIDFIKPSMYTDSGVVITSSSLSADKKQLTVNFDGFAPDSKAIFCVDLDLDPNDPASDDYFPYPDYRNVLFGAPLETGSGPTDPATVTATLGPPEGRTISGVLTQLTDTPVWQNEAIRPYGLADPVEVLTFQIPEPSSVAMALGAGAAAVMAGRRSRRSKRGNART